MMRISCAGLIAVLLGSSVLCAPTAVAKDSGEDSSEVATSNQGSGEDSGEKKHSGHELEDQGNGSHDDGTEHEGGDTGIDQILRNDSIVVQAGASNTATVNQQARLTGRNSGREHGDDNERALESGLIGNWAKIYQNGIFNDAAITQSGTGNAAEIGQRGDSNHAVIGQTGSGLDVTIEQDGNGHHATVILEGAGRVFDINQSGPIPQSIDIFQSGGDGRSAPITINQHN